MPDHEHEGEHGARRAGWSQRLLYWSANTALGAMVLFTVVDVFGRYVFNRPLRGGLEFTEFLMVVLIFAGLPLVTAADEHVSFDLVDRYFPRWAQPWQQAFGQAVCVALSLGLAWILYARGVRMIPIGDSTQILKVPLYPFAFFMAGLMAVNAAGHALRLWQTIARRHEHPT